MAVESTYQYGSQPRFAATFEVAGTATDPTATKFKYIDPAGTEVEYVYGTDVELVRDSAGNFHVDLLLTQSGLWRVRWVGTGQAAAAREYSVRVESTGFASPQ